MKAVDVGWWTRIVSANLGTCKNVFDIRVRAHPIRSASTALSDQSGSFSPSVLRCFGAGAIEASMICPAIGI